MSDWNDFLGLKFQRPQSRISSRMGWVAGIPIIFTVGWLIFSPASLYWPLMLTLATLTWMASYGWRPAVINLIGFLQGITGLK